jgi:hypothetical protein
MSVRECHGRAQGGLVTVEPLDQSKLSSFNLKILACRLDR